jgi:Endonuclease-reverse transcriptase
VGSELLVGVVYRSPKIPYASFAAEMEDIVSGIADENEILLMGDFNLDPVNAAPNFRRFESMFSAYGLCIVDSPPTRITENTATILDRFIIKDPGKVTSLGVHPVSSIADHELVVIDLAYSRPVEEPVVKYFRDFNRLNVTALEQEFRAQDWSSVL